MKRFNLLIWLLIWLLVCLISSGCGGKEELLQRVDVRDSIEIVVALRRSGIDADRVKVSSSRSEQYKILVGTHDSTRALELLKEYGLPRKPQESMVDILTQKGFSPQSPEIADLKLDYALGTNVERLLSVLPGVIEARTLIRTHLQDRRGDRKEQRTPSASVVIRYSSESGTVPFSESEVRDIVAKAVPGLKPSAVEVKPIRAIFGETGASVSVRGADGEKYQQLKPLLLFAVEKDRLKAWFQLMALLFGCILGSLAVGMFVGSRGRRAGARRAPKRSGTEQDKNFFIEAAFKSEGTTETGKFLAGKSQGKPPKGSGKRN